MGERAAGNTRGSEQLEEVKSAAELSRLNGLNSGGIGNKQKTLNFELELEAHRLNA